MRRPARRGGAADRIRNKRGADWRRFRSAPCIFVFWRCDGEEGCRRIAVCVVCGWKEKGLACRCLLWRGVGCAGFTWKLCYSALTRRNDIPFYRIVNCAPARRCVWPVLAPARAWVGAGERRGGIRNWECGVGLRGIAVLLERLAFVLRPSLRFYCDVLRQITPAVCRTAPNRSACGVSRSYSRVGRNRH